ncbi:MAG: hypothetical protein JST35_06090 [Armatimonadetes bacterium]|nr:hypothetical protein [Armatimonadota bacterium]
MRKSLFFCGAALLGTILAGCNNGGGSAQIRRVVVGYVWVSTNSTPAGSPDVVVTGNATAPAGYAAPTGGTFTLNVADGEITRGADSETFTMSSSNQIAAYVKLNNGNSVTFSATGLSYTDPVTNVTSSKTPIPSTNQSISGTNDTVAVLSFQAPTYTPGAPAALKVIVRDPSGANKFGAPATVIPNIVPSANSGDRYEIAVVALDANNVVIPGTTQTVTDTNSNASETATSVSGSFMTVGGAGVEGQAVVLTCGITQNSSLTTTVNTVYSYGNRANFIAAFTPSAEQSVIWPASGGAATVAYTVNVKNGRGINVPNENITLRRRNTAGTVENNYPAPASGSALSTTTVTTDASGNGTFDFQTPAGAAGNSGFNSLNIKYKVGNPLVANRVDALTSGTNVVGTASVVVTRPLSSLTIAGPARLDVGTSTLAANVNQTSNPYNVTGAIDIDTQTIAAPTGTYAWTLTPVAAGANTVGDPDNTSPRSVAAPATNGSTTGSVLNVDAGSIAGQFTVQADFGGTLSNTLTVDVYGPPAKVILSPTPAVGGIAFASGEVKTVSTGFVDSFGHAMTLSAPSNGVHTVLLTGKTGGQTSGNGNIVSQGAAPNPNWTVTASSTGIDSTFQLTLSGTWGGRGQGAQVGSGAWNLIRTFVADVP